MITFENFKEAVDSLDYMHMFPDSHFEEDGGQLIEDIDAVFGVVLDLLYEEIYHATDKDTRSLAYENKLYSARDTLRAVHHGLTKMIGKQYNYYTGEED